MTVYGNQHIVHNVTGRQHKRSSCSSAIIRCSPRMYVLLGMISAGFLWATAATAPPSGSNADAAAERVRHGSVGRVSIICSCCRCCCGAAAVEQVAASAAT